MLDYELISDFRNNKRFNNEFLNLIKKRNNKTSFYETWLIKSNKWDESFVPHALLNPETNSIDAIIGVIRMNVFVDKVRYDAIQLVSLYVHEDHLDQNLDELMVKKVLNLYENVKDIIFSYDLEINKFLVSEPGYHQFGDYRWWIKWDQREKVLDTIANRLDTTSSRELNLLKESISHTHRVSPWLATTNDSSVKIYNILKYFSRDVYYLPEKEIFVVFTIDNNVFKLISVYAHNKINWAELLEILIPSHITEVEFAFIPPEGVFEVLCTTEDCRPTTPFGSPGVNMVLKVMAGGLKNFDKPFYFPLLSRAR